jgi:predicted RNA polymerase sigma factor
LRQAITLREIEGLSYEEIAELMNCPIGTVRSRIFRAREAIATRLRPLLDTQEECALVNMVANRMRVEAFGFGERHVQSDLKPTRQQWKTCLR